MAHCSETSARAEVVDVALLLTFGTLLRIEVGMGVLPLTMYEERFGHPAFNNKGDELFFIGDTEMVRIGTGLGGKTRGLREGAE